MCRRHAGEGLTLKRWTTAIETLEPLRTRLSTTCDAHSQPRTQLMRARPMLS